MSIYKTIKVIQVNENGVIYVENEKGEAFGIVCGARITDEDGLMYENSTLEIIEQNFECDLEQDWDTGATTIYTECGGKIVITGYSAQLVG